MACSIRLNKCKRAKIVNYADSLIDFPDLREAVRSLVHECNTLAQAGEVWPPAMDLANELGPKPPEPMNEEKRKLLAKVSTVPVSRKKLDRIKNSC